MFCKSGLPGRALLLVDGASPLPSFGTYSCWGVSKYPLFAVCVLTGVLLFVPLLSVSSRLQDGDLSEGSRWSCASSLGGTCSISYDLGGVRDLSELRLGEATYARVLRFCCCGSHKCTNDFLRVCVLSFHWLCRPACTLSAHDIIRWHSVVKALSDGPAGVTRLVCIRCRPVCSPGPSHARRSGQGYIHYVGRC